MSETIYDKDGLSVTAFWGGNERGRCLQFTAPAKQYAQITHADAIELVFAIERWSRTMVPYERTSTGPAPIVTPLGCKHHASCPYKDQDTCAWHACRALRGQGNAIDHPAHYGGKDDPYEAIKVIRAWELGFNLGNAVKYVRRAGRKPGADLLEDLKKAAWYLNDEIADIEKRGAK